YPPGRRRDPRAASRRSGPHGLLRRAHGSGPDGRDMDGAGLRDRPDAARLRLRNRRARPPPRSAPIRRAGRDAPPARPGNRPPARAAARAPARMPPQPPPPERPPEPVSSSILQAILNVRDWRRATMLIVLGLAALLGAIVWQERERLVAATTAL